ncbi:hypothetical protein C0J52_19961 [Blattella germanica]|nr:hypothetical protein C0J52_19961 [Blattella germanica]
MCKWILLFCAIFSVGILGTSGKNHKRKIPLLEEKYDEFIKSGIRRKGDLLVYLRGCATNHNTDANFDGKRYTYSSCSTKLCNNGGSRVSATAIIPALIISAAVALKQII